MLRPTVLTGDNEKLKDDYCIFYEGKRGAPNLIAMYADKCSKVTGEVHCVHLDWRISRSYAIRRAGISNVRDLVHFDHRKFWSERFDF